MFEILVGVISWFFIIFVLHGLLVLGGDFIAVYRFVTVFPAKMTDNNRRFLLVFEILIRRRR